MRVTIFIDGFHSGELENTPEIRSSELKGRKSGYLSGIHGAAV